MWFPKSFIFSDMPLAVFYTQYVGSDFSLQIIVAKLLFENFGVFSEFSINFGLLRRSGLRICTILCTLNVMCYKLPYCHCYSPQRFSGDAVSEGLAHRLISKY